MMKKLVYSALIVLSLFSVAACSGEPDQPDSPVIPAPGTGDDVTPPAADKLEIKINPSLNDSRATDTDFEHGDNIGLFVVNYNGSDPGALKNTGNHVDNMRFTYSGTWTPYSPVYWKDDEVHADFYIYYPYASSPSVSAYPVEVKADQSSESNYKTSDFLWGIARNVAPTASAISIPASHVMSRINITVEAGSGFTKESLAAATISVRVNGLQCKSTVNLADGTVTPSGDRVSVAPYKKGDAYIAIIVPQTVQEGNLITVTVDGSDFNLKKGFTFESGKSHDFNVVVGKTSGGVNVNITPWQNDGTDNGGTAE